MPEAAVLEAPPQPAAPAAPSAPPMDPDEVGSRMNSFAEKNPVSRTVEKPEPKAAPKVESTPKTEPKKEEAKVDPPKEAPKEVPKAEAPKVDPAEAPKTPEVPKPRLGEMYRNERKAHEETQTKLAALTKEVETLRSQKPEFDVTQHPDFIKHKTRAEELENEIRFVNYEKSSEFKEKYDAPYKEAWAQNAARAQQFTVKLQKENELGEKVDSGTRAVTQNEFWAIVTADDNTAIELADKLFPDSASKSTRIQQLAEDVRSKGQSLQKALTEARSKGAEREKQTLAQKQQQEHLTRKQAEERADKWSQIAESDRVDPRVKDLFNANDDDAKGKEILTKGQKAASLAFGLMEDGDKALEGDAEIAAHAEVYNKAAAFNYNVYKRRQAEALVEELTKKLSEYEKSEPGPGAPKGGEVPAVDDSDARMERFAAR